MRVLGVNNGHDSAAALVVDGEVAFFIEEERLNRIKHGVSLRERNRLSGTPDAPFPSRSVAYCLEAAGLSLADVDAVVVTVDEPAAARHLPGLPSGRFSALPPGSHHLAHALAAFHASPFDAAAVLVADHSGSSFEVTGSDSLSPGGLRGLAPDFLGQTLFAAKAPPEQIDPRYVYEAETGFFFGSREDAGETLFKNVHPLRDNDTHGFGAMYAACCEITGFVNRSTGMDQAGKLMGLAAYGEPLAEGWGLLGQEGPAFDFRAFAGWFRGLVMSVGDGLTGSQAADVAHEAQRVLEHGLLRQAAWLRERTGTARLCISGGVGLNVPANARILGAGLFEEVYVLPCCTDAGNAVGAAFWGALQLGEKPRSLARADLGRAYDAAEIYRALGHRPHERLEEDELASRVARLLAEGSVVGWFQGRGEGGPRALGHRSILADPRPHAMKDHVNINVKGRESFRPLAPAILANHDKAWFGGETSPYMLLAADVRPERQASVRAVVHVDGTARPQKVDGRAHPRFRSLLEEFHAHTGIPLLMNTSFNVRGEPIVETPDDALSALDVMELDALVMEDRLVPSRDVGGRMVRAVPDWGGSIRGVMASRRYAEFLERLEEDFGMAPSQISDVLEEGLRVLDSGKPRLVRHVPTWAALEPVLLQRIALLLFREEVIEEVGSI